MFQNSSWLFPIISESVFTGNDRKKNGPPSLQMKIRFMQAETIQYMTLPAAARTWHPPVSIQESGSEFICLGCFLDGNSNGNRGTDHGVVAHADEAHHLDVRRNG